MCSTAGTYNGFLTHDYKVESLDVGLGCQLSWVCVCVSVGVCICGTLMSCVVVVVLCLCLRYAHRVHMCVLAVAGPDTWPGETGVQT